VFLLLKWGNGFGLNNGDRSTTDKSRGNKDARKGGKKESQNPRTTLIEKPGNESHSFMADQKKKKKQDETKTGM